MESVKEMANPQPEPMRDAGVLFALKSARARYSAIQRKQRARLGARSARSMPGSGFTVSSFAHRNARVEALVNTATTYRNPFILHTLQFP